ncbi:hypothetical protein [Streptomyces sp. NPDC047000]|uniref:hypothetical protein n=1 Tax=Streptomyces sp. NPDC047000 TaxID=3155474 RepID=UPI0033F4FEF2
MTPTVTRRRRPAAARAAVLGACAVAVFTIAGCGGSGGSGASGATTPGPAATGTVPGGSGSGGTGTFGASGASGGVTASAKPAAETSAAPAATTSSAASAKPAGTAGSAAGGGTGCDHKMPISPDELAVYRYTPEGGALHLIVRLGNWGCAPADSDGAPFVTVGKEIPMPLDQAAYVTATNPIVESSANQHIGVQEFLDWLDAHPDSGLVFKYHVGGDGAIDRLDEVFTP